MNPGKIIILFLFSMSTLLYGEIFLDIENPTPQVGETFTMNVIMEKKEKYDIENIENFRVLSRYTSSNTSITNGSKSSIYRDSYELLSLNEGTFPLKAIGRSEQSNTVNIEVGGQPLATAPDTKYILDISPKKDTYYFGEKIPYIESLITTVSLQGIDYLERPDFDDLSITDINTGKIGSLQSKTTLEGKDAIDIVLYQGLLEPSSSGIRKVGGSIVRIALDGRDPFSRRTETIAGIPREITILPLPDGVPKNFKNLVGTLESEDELDRTSVKQGEAVTMTIKLSGSADLTSLKDIVPKDDPNFNIYENTVSSDMWIEDRQFTNEKIFQIAFVPKKAGNFETPKIEIPYFDTEKKGYSNLVIEKRSIEVTEGAGISTESAPRTLDSAREIAISTIPAVIETKDNNKYIFTLLGLVILIQGGVITYLLRDRFSLSYKTDDHLRPLKKSRDDREFYDNYCIFMKNKYSFNPKAHSSDKIDDSMLRDIHLEIERSRFNNKTLDKKNIIKKLESLV